MGLRLAARIGAGDRHGDRRDEHGLLTLAELDGTLRSLPFLLAHLQLPNRV